MARRGLGKGLLWFISGRVYMIDMDVVWRDR